jgi:hypothetical protein
MGKTSGLGDQFAYGGIDVGGDINAISRIGGGPAPILMTDITQYAVARSGGRLDGAVEFVSFFDPATGASHDQFSPLSTADAIGTYWHGQDASAVGAPAATVVAKQTTYDPNEGDDGSFLFNIQLLPNGYGVEWGRLLTPGKRTDGAAGNGSSFDQGSVSPGSFGWRMHYHLFAFTGTSVTMKVQESSDNGAGDAFSDVSGATTGALTSAPAAGRVAATSGTVERYVRLVTTGTFSNALFLVQFVRNPVAVTL